MGKCGATRGFVFSVGRYCHLLPILFCGGVLHVGKCEGCSSGKYRSMKETAVGELVESRSEMARDDGVVSS